MPPKPTFRVKLSATQQENVPLPTPTMTSFALPGTLAEDKLRRKSQRESSFNNSKILKTRLSEWNLNLSSAGPLSDSITTSIANGMPTSQTPWNTVGLGPIIELETGAATLVDEASWMASGATYPL